MLFSDSKQKINSNFGLKALPAHESPGRENNCENIFGNNHSPKREKRLQAGFREDLRVHPSV